MRTLNDPLMKTAVVFYSYAVLNNKEKLSKDELVKERDSLIDFCQHSATWDAFRELFGDNSHFGDKSVSFQNAAWNMIQKVNDEGIVNVLYRDGELEVHPQKELIIRFYDVLPKLLSELYKKEMRVFSYFSSICDRYNRYHSYGFCFDEGISRKIRQRYNLGKEDVILYVVEKNIDTGTFKSCWDWASGLVVTDQGIYYANETHYDYTNGYCVFDSELTKWDDFDKVEYKELTYYFYKDEELVSQLDKGILFDNQDPNECIRFAEDLTNMARLYNPDLSPIKLAEQGHLKEALEKADSIIRSGKNVPFGHLSKAQVMQMIEFEKINKDASYGESTAFERNLAIVLKEYKKAIKEEESTEDKSKKVFVIHALLCMADAEKLIGRYADSRNHYIVGLGNCDDKEKDDIMESLIAVEESLQKDWDNYTTQYRYKDRKFIMPIRDNEIGGCVANGISVFRMSNIPSCMKFPLGHPVVNQLYIGHPFNSSLYVPYEDSEELFFIDKVHELRYLLESLGAEEISITSVKGKEVSELNDESLRIFGGAEIKRFSAEAGYNTQSKGQYDTSSHNQRTVTVKLDPMQKPFLPDGLIWYNEMPQWQRLVQSRLRGNLLEYSEFVSTAETKFTSSSEMTDIKASAKFLWAKAHAEVNECFEKQFKESTETQWKVDVKFRSMKDFEDQMSDTIKNEKVEPVNQIGWSKEEQDYAEEVKFCLEDDGVIDDSERRLLERKRIKLGISQKCAAEIENSLLQPQLTEDEQEYLEAVKEELVGGKIPEASRRLLERLKKRMDISEERAKEIEIMAMKR